MSLEGKAGSEWLRYDLGAWTKVTRGQNFQGLVNQKHRQEATPTSLLPPSPSECPTPSTRLSFRPFHTRSQRTSRASGLLWVLHESSGPSSYQVPAQRDTGTAVKKSHPTVGITGGPPLPSGINGHDNDHNHGIDDGDHSSKVYSAERFFILASRHSRELRFVPIIQIKHLRPRGRCPSRWWS